VFAPASSCTDNLEAVGLLFEVDREGDKMRGDFWARPFVLEAV
jgi:hypothetical protein